jgi:hypothetical protein
VNDPELVNESYQRFMINRFRELLPYSEVPIKLLVRGRTGRKGEINEMKTDRGGAQPARSGRAKSRSERKRAVAAKRAAATAGSAGLRPIKTRSGGVSAEGKRAGAKKRARAEARGKKSRRGPRRP